VRRLLSIALPAVLAGLVIPGATAAKGFETLGAAGGVAVSGSPYRYVAIAPGRRDKLTVVERIGRNGGRVSRWWYLRGGYYIPAVAYDGSPGGLSADGSTLVLTQFPNYLLATPTTRLAILKTGRVTRPPGWHHPRRWVRFVDLRGDFSVDAISPDGSTVFLTHYRAPTRPGSHLGAREVRALDTATGRLLRTPVLAPEEPKGQRPNPRDGALPISNTTGPGGRWAYTVFGGNGQVPFIEVLDTSRRQPVTYVDLPQLKSQRNPFLLKVRMQDQGRRILVLKRSTIQGGRPKPLLQVDPATGGVQKVARPATPSNGTSPWTAIGLASVVALLGMAWGARRRRRTTEGDRPERA
jgi:hypothetical protein